MVAHSIFALIENDTVQNLIIALDQNDANDTARLCYINGIAIDCTYCPCKIGDKYLNGKFYRKNLETGDLTEVEEYEDPYEQIEELRNAIDLLLSGDI